MNPDKVINQDNSKYEARKNKRMIELSRALNKVDKIQVSREKQAQRIAELPDTVDPTVKQAHHILLQIYDTLTYAAISWCTHERYNQAQFEIEEENLGLCIQNLNSQLEKERIRISELRHVITVTRKALDSFLAGDFIAKAKKKNLEKSKKLLSAERKKPKKVKAPKQQRTTNPFILENPLFVETDF